LGLREPPSVSFSVRTLNRGGVVVHWGELLLQVGAYPETVKDTIQSTEGVPQIFVVPEQLFDPYLGVSAAELEFPVYFNFYLKQRKIRFVCRKHQLRPLLRVIREAVFGPSSLDYAEEYLGGAEAGGYPELLREMRWYKLDPKRPRGRLLLRDLVTPLVFDDNGSVDLDGYRLEDLGHDRYRVSKDGEQHEFRFQSPGSVAFDEPAVAERFNPPMLGLTVLGSGHGFDVRSLTSGFILWVGGKGILVDPPVHSTEWLRHQNVDGRFVEHIILTHCHADHDSGTLQKVLQESRVTVHTTPTVMRSFVAKYRSITNLTGEQFLRLFAFRPISVGRPVNIAGADFTFKYMLHPIPTLGFHMEFQGRSIAYSCDTLYDPPTIRKLTDEGVMTPGRAEDLLNFKWDADLVIHEAGIPPIHTPMDVLAALPDDVKQRMYLTHVSESAIPENSGLRLAPPGIASTLSFEVESPDVSHSQQFLDTLAQVDMFHSLSISRAAEFLRISRYSKLPAGSLLVKAGERGEDFHIILSGEAEVIRDGQPIKRAGRYDYIGEIAVVLDRPRIADVVAATELEVLSMSRQDFLDFIRGTDIADLLRRVARNKMEGSWAVFSRNKLLESLSTFQKTQLLAIMSREHREPGDVLFAKGEPVSSFWLVFSGQVDLELPSGNTHPLQPGALLGRINEDLSACTYDVTARAASALEIYRMPMRGMEAFFRANPGSFIRVLRQQNEHPLGAVV
jgi:CRP-like cAMP-binding protein/phosphoribosyl 1,2-cyclic phosphodiesterase